MTKSVLSGFAVFLLISISHVQATQAATSLLINYGDVDLTRNELVLRGINFNAFGQPVVTIGDTVISNCEVLASEIRCPIAGTPAMSGGTWKVKVSSGNSPHANAEIDVFNTAGIVTQVCVSGDRVECYSGSPETRNIGQCQTGYRVCSDGTWSDCQGEIVPEAEACFSGLDEDCDDLTDLADPDCATACGDLTACGDSCVDLTSDELNCGGCGEVCQYGSTCVAGQCQSVCAPGWVLCGGSCVDPASDEQNCGRCANPCSPNNISALCAAGVCSGTCNSGWGDCNSNKQSDGCETNLSADANNCGDCGQACAPGSTCVAGQCSVD